MSRRWATWTAWTLVAIAFVTRTVALVIEALALDDEIIFNLIWGLPAWAIVTIGAVVVSRQPRNAVGWLMLSVVAEPIAILSFDLVQLDTVADLPLPGMAAMAFLAHWLAPPMPTIAIPLTFLLFPTGRPLSPAWRPVVWLTVGWALVILAATAFSPINVAAAETLAGLLIINPIAAPEAIGQLLVGAQNVAWSLTPLVGLTAAGSMVVRFGRSRGTERQQLKWVVLAVVLLAGLVVIGLALSAAGAPEGVAFAFTNLGLLAGLIGLFVAIGIAMVRHRLFDIDLVIRRTLVYGLLTAILAVVYVGTTLLLQGALGAITGDTTLAVAASTLAVAALFRPVRGRVQAAVDRRFYRSRYDAGRTVAAFSSRLRGDVDLDALTDRLADTAEETMRPASVSVWLKQAEPGR